jgi:hypothetical protein
MVATAEVLELAQPFTVQSTKYVVVAEILGVV